VLAVALAATMVFGHSVDGRPLQVTRVGDADAPVRVLVVGDVHGNEPAGEAIVARLRRSRLDGVAFWLVRTANPDGRALGTRQNARGVDLNRNFPSQWRPLGVPGDPQYAGPRPLSEPESRFAVRAIKRIRPDVTIWFHQPQTIVRAFGQSEPTARRYARLVGMLYRRIHWPSGTAANWQNHTFPGRPAFVVELAPGRLSPASARRHARAIRRLAAGG
jgi:murein peptide amidase A